MNKGMKRVTYYEGFPPRKVQRYEQRLKLSDRLTPFCFMLGISLACLTIRSYFSNYGPDIIVKAEGVPVPSPVSEQGVANNAELDSPKPTTTPAPTQKQEIINYIVEVFGEDAPDAIAVATCESNLNPSIIGDRNLITWHGNDIVGDSVGLFQIRTGGKDFNRARANGMSPDDFREHLLDWKNNVDYAKTIFNRSGWQPWTCKKVLGQ